ncbi:MAG: 1-acyl-sn-glycerol-3-phosphate acyltransferase [Gammaproteobacteria bacterium]|nr:1-acyl-sn-glycerol-3-phosphate acyltransferase [Gammaproteobacteria bacterium]MDH4312061.1 1-acyl-sn-glycerol-3-phosphate acyltransferase [Gammaproteobacteria bacterium]MDH5271941.1 1-acyl-sn-glycerol-3-phosphate acyltransferase [Gammaproteobacteria bacterium]
MRTKSTAPDDQTARTSAPSAADAVNVPARPRAGSVPGWLFRLVFGAYSLTLLFLLLSVAGLLALVLPSLHWRRSSTRWVARLWLALACLRLRVDGLEHLPESPCVLVANHSSYLDGVVMKAGLPPRFSFVVKREAADMPVMGFLLRRIGAEFVDRHSAGGRQRGARRVMQRAEQGHSLAFFPEGTFDSVVGLKRFHPGAFVAAARGGVPLVPAVIHGTRRSMPNGAIVPMPGTIRIEILPPIDSDGRKPDELRNAARAVMLERLGEPDLVELAAAPARSR